MKTEESLRATFAELKDLPPGEVFGAAFMEIAKRKISAFNALLDDPSILRQDEEKTLQDALDEALRAEGQCKAKCDEWASKQEATQQEIQTAENQESSALLVSLSTRLWKCQYYKSKQEADTKGCPGRDPIDPRIADPWRTQRIAELKESLDAIQRALKAAQAAYAAATDETQRRRDAVEIIRRAINKALGGIERQVGQWEAREKDAEQYTAVWRSLNDEAGKREKRERDITASSEAMRKARERFERRKGQLSTYYDYVLKHIISATAAGSIEVNGDGVWPRTNNAVADSGTTLRQYADVLGFDLACLVGSVAGVGHLPRLWIHDSPRQADSEEQLYHSTLLLLSELESKFVPNRGPSFQYILTTTSAAPPALNHSPYVRLRLHGRSPNGKLFKRDLGK